MLRLLHRTRGDIQLVATFIAICLIWIPRFFVVSEPHLFPEHIFFNRLFGWTGNLPLISTGLTMLFVIISAYTERMALDYDRLRISGRFFPLFLFIFLASGANTGLFSPIVLSMFILSLAIRPALIATEEPENDHLIFLAAFLFGTATFFYVPMAFMLIYWLVAVVVFEDSKIRKIVLALLGFLLPWLWFIAALYLSDNMVLLTDYREAISFKLHLSGIFANPGGFILTCITVLVYLIFIFSRLARQQETLFIIRRRIRTSVMMVVFLFIGAFFSYDFLGHLALLALPMTIIISYSFHEGLRSAWEDYILLGLLVLIVLYSFLNIWL